MLSINRDQEQRAHLASLASTYQPLVRRVVARNLRPADAHLADDLAQDVWLTAWQYLLRGNTITRPAGLLSTMARRRVVDHYRSARVRREVLTDTISPTSGFARSQARELVAA